MASNEELDENCSRCNKSITTEEYITNGGLCEECMNKKENEKVTFKGIKQEMRANTYKAIQNSENMILTTTNEIKGYNVTEYIGIVAGTDIYLVGGIFGGGLANQEQLYATALLNATTKLKQNAEALGANAVIGIQSNLTSTGGTNNIIVTLTGTAVKLSK